MRQTNLCLDIIPFAEQKIDGEALSAQPHPPNGHHDHFECTRIGDIEVGVVKVLHDLHPVQRRQQLLHRLDEHQSQRVPHCRRGFAGVQTWELIN